uniref:Uncharacterized protein n=1 Tax=Amphimedon queenslandica TaxID=400682 RepID=A0A1X7UTF9_AMPQE
MHLLMPFPQQARLISFSKSTNPHSSLPSFPGRAVTPLGPMSAVDLPPLGATVRSLFKEGLAASSHRSYRSARNPYLEFCRRANLRPLPNNRSRYAFLPRSSHGRGSRPDQCRLTCQPYVT